MSIWIGDRYLDLTSAELVGNEPLDLRNIAERLYRRHRFCAATDWTVLHHSVLCAAIALREYGTRDEVQACAFHDSAEAYLGDIPAPLKAIMCIGGERIIAVEEKLLESIKKNLGLRFCDNEVAVREVDQIAFEMEVVGLFSQREWGYFGVNSEVNSGILSVISGLILRNCCDLVNIFVNIFYIYESVGRKLESIIRP
jgi:hypothetical protein